MATPWKAVMAGVLALGQASAAGPAEVQDPPGRVDVDQPAGVSLSERNTERDATDTLRGGGRTDVIEGEREGIRTSGPDIRASEARGDVQQGPEARASFESGTGSAAEADDAASGTSDAAAEDAEGSTVLGADAAGYGMGTEPVPAR